jgi:hypothetical protein
MNGHRVESLEISFPLIYIPLALKPLFGLLQGELFKEVGE